jgi:hypothetical protein
MKKQYAVAQLKETSLDSQLIRMLTREGFIDVFWEELSIRRKEDPKVTYENVFEFLNEKYFNTFGTHRYSNFESFRRRLNE